MQAIQIGFTNSIIKLIKSNIIGECMMLTSIVVINTVDPFVVPLKSEIRSGLTYAPYLSRETIG